MSTSLNPDAKRKCVDMLLAYSGTPRDHLYEYPHRSDDSDRYISNAEGLLDQILAAALPVLTSAKASAWEEGFQAGWEEHEDPGAFVNDFWDAKTPNPYLPEKS